MSEVQATIVAVEGETAIVRTDETGCGRCHEKGGCGGQNVARMFCATPRQYRVANPRGALVGERVTVQVDTGTIAVHATRAYAFPLIGMLSAAILGASLGGELWSIMAAILGLLAGWWFGLRMRKPLENRQERPHIL